MREGKASDEYQHTLRSAHSKQLKREEKAEEFPSEPFPWSATILPVEQDAVRGERSSDIRSSSSLSSQSPSAAVIRSRRYRETTSNVHTRRSASRSRSRSRSRGKHVRNSSDDFSTDSKRAGRNGLSSAAEGAAEGRLQDELSTLDMEIGAIVWL
jgi:hypothetical protein